MSFTLHASCVSIRGRGVLLTGHSGSGKSDLALRLIDRGATLVSDDGTVVDGRDGRLFARPGPNIAGMIEARGVGILTMPHLDEVQVAICITLDARPDRLPCDPLPVRTFAGASVPHLTLAPFEISAAFKVEQALEIYGLRL